MNATLGHEYYHDPAIFEFECEQVFRRHWWRLATEAELAEKAQQHGVDTASIRPNSEQVIDEDITICEQVQFNLLSGVYPGGLLSAQQEPGTIYFQQLVRDALSGFPEPEPAGASS